MDEYMRLLPRDWVQERKSDSHRLVGAIASGFLSGVCLQRVKLLAILTIMTAVSCFFTCFVHTFTQLAWCRGLTGIGIGGSLPIVYSMVGDWFPAHNRAWATGIATAAMGLGVFFGQALATLMGNWNWRWPFFFVSIPSVLIGTLMWFTGREPQRGAQEDTIETIYASTGLNYVPAFTMRQWRQCMLNKTNLLVMMQAFPGNIPWGVIVVYMHDFLIQDLSLSRERSLLAISVLAMAALLGVLAGGAIGQALYSWGHGQFLPVFAGITNVLRAVPFLLVFGWERYFGNLHGAGGDMVCFFILLIFGGFLATMATPCLSAVLLNVNMPETRGSVVACYSVMDDLSKGIGTLFISMAVPSVGRAMAYQLCLWLWIFSGLGLLMTCYTVREDEMMMKRYLDEAATESLVRVSKERAQKAIKERAKVAGETHFARSKERLHWPNRQPGV
eukprot:GEMP01044128.1.p1 GENE.GEMP01044128.1~~GEMP01044128.1.p1  ORF type:complete len:445 (+),score=97.79 GEMP01044128.1:212-1546(+)